jgi:CXXX repeat modification system protein
MHPLTPKQLKEIDEITLDKISAEATLKIALTYHSNRINKIKKQEKEWWEDMAEVYKLDKSKNWYINFTGPIICIEEKQED